MAENNQSSKLTEDPQRYQKLVDEMEPKPALVADALSAFATGGIVGLIGQALTDMYAALLNLSPVEAGAPAVATIIFLTALLTGLGVFDKLARYAGAGLTVPVTGFANSMTSAALEFRSEGFVLGVGSKMFSLAGTVIAWGVVTAFFVGIVASLLP